MADSFPAAPNNCRGQGEIWVNTGAGTVEVVSAASLSRQFDVMVIESNMDQAEVVLEKFREAGFRPQLGEHCDEDSGQAHDWIGLYLGRVPVNDEYARQVGFLGTSLKKVKVLIAEDSPWRETLSTGEYEGRVVTLPADLEVAALEDALTGDHDSHPDSKSAMTRLVGNSVAMRAIKHDIRKTANSDSSVLIRGESGTGKECVARTFHELSSRAKGEFVAINCGAIPAELLESELFGHEKGSFTGAYTSRKGRFEQAEGGTLFLDEIGDMSLSMQVKLLRVLQERRYERVGGNKSLTANVRIIAATHRDLEAMIKNGEFREDLYYRLNVLEVKTPSLRDRVEDLPLLIGEFNKRLTGRFTAVRFSEQAIRALSSYQWTGNVRELQNLVERMANYGYQREIQVPDLPEKYRAKAPIAETTNINERVSLLHGLAAPVVDTAAPATNECISVLPPEGIDLKSYLENLESSFIRQALDTSDGVVAHAAKKLGLQRTTLAEKMRKYQLVVPSKISA